MAGAFVFFGCVHATPVAPAPISPEEAPKYALDGRNIVMDGPFKTIRVDDFSGATQKWFVYDLSVTYYCTKR